MKALPMTTGEITSIKTSWIHVLYISTATLFFAKQVGDKKDAKSMEFSIKLCTADFY